VDVMELYLIITAHGRFDGDFAGLVGVSATVPLRNAVRLFADCEDYILQA